MPPSVVAKLNETLNEIIADENEEFGQFLADESERWNAVREAAGITRQ
jgi:hypothetical protein